MSKSDSEARRLRKAIKELYQYIGNGSVLKLPLEALNEMQKTGHMPEKIKEIVEEKEKKNADSSSESSEQSV